MDNPSLGKSVQRGNRRVYLVQVARIQRTLVWLVLVLILMYAALIGGAFVRGNFGAVLGAIMLLCLLLVGVAGIVQTVRLAHAVGSNIVLAVIGGLLMLLPLIGFILLVLTNQRATRILRQNGAKVGFMGVSKEGINKLLLGACTGCGYDIRGLQSPQCPECGKAIEARDLQWA